MGFFMVSVSSCCGKRVFGRKDRRGSAGSTDSLPECRGDGRRDADLPSSLGPSGPAISPPSRHPAPAMVMSRERAASAGDQAATAAVVVMTTRMSPG